MNFDLVAPCAHCPFRTDIRPFLTPARAAEILDAITRGQCTFQCHKTLEPGVKDQHCAGASILLEKIGKPNQMMRIAERCNAYDHRKLRMDAPVYATPAAMKAAHRKARRATP